MNDQRLNQVLAGVVFLLSLVLYLSTLAPTVSFWDCGEFIACSYRLGVPHPPGAPLFLLVGRVFTLIPEFLVENVARRVNLISAFSSAFTVMFLYLIIVHLVKQFLKENDGFLRFVPFMAGLVGALTFAMTPSFWFNAAEAEVYAPSMLFTSLVVWLVFHWSERHDEPGNERYILLIAYLMGLSIGVHLLVILVIPMIIMIIYYKRFELNTRSVLIMGAIGLAITGLVYPGMVKGIPNLASKFGFEGLVLVIAVVVGLTYWAIKNRKSILSISLMSVLLITIGYSSYLMIYVRSNLDPNIDENNPETIEKFIKYINREQYGVSDPLDREGIWRSSDPAGTRYSSSWDFFWSYQVNKMYVRYFLWNFGGIAEDGHGFDLTRFWFIPLFLGLFGAYYQFIRDWRNGLVILVLFFMTGLAIVLYLNQPDPQPRERDYSYVGSFFAFAVWVGIGAAAVLESVVKLLRQSGRESLSNAMGWIVTAALLLGAPVQMMAKNYRTHDRTGNYVAWDYSYNMLESAEPNGIIYTNGDNDTFPLWYLQEVENIRTDVRVANLSLLNTPWYIKQLKHKEPKVPISLSDAQIEKINLQPWPKAKNFEIPMAPDPIRRAEIERYKISLNKPEAPTVDKIIFELEPKLQVPTSSGRSIGVLRVQDLMLLNTLHTNRFRKPIYFAVTASEKNRLDGLKRYQRMDGLLFKVTTIPDWNIDPEVLYNNLMHKFRYTNLNNPDVYFNDNIVGLLQNYRSAFFRLASHYLNTNNKERFDEVIRKIYEVMPPEVIPFTNQQFNEVMNAFAFLADVYPLDSLSADNFSLRQLQACGEVGITYRQYELARRGYEPLLEVLVNQPESQMVHDYIRALFRRPSFYDRATPEQRAQALNDARNQMRQQLVRVYKALKDYDAGIELLQKWVEVQPENKFALRELESFKKLKGETQDGS